MSRKPAKRGNGFLNGRLLLAMPTMSDPRFAKSVVLLCHHTPDTAMGLVLNRAIGGMTFDSLLSQLKIERVADANRAMAVHYGGPVQTSRGFLLHSDDYALNDATLQVAPGVALTATVDVLRALARGAGPKRAFFALGYAAWGAGQIEAELQDNAWLIGEPDDDAVFGDDLDMKWLKAMAKIGVDPGMMSEDYGRA